MKARQRITMLLKEWLEITHFEAQAIQTSRWTALTRIQKGKSALQKPLTEAIEQWKIENSEEAASNPFRESVNRLLTLESHNSGLLAVRKREVREKMLLLEQALDDLKHPNAHHAHTQKIG